MYIHFQNVNLCSLAICDFISIYKYILSSSAFNIQIVTKIVILT